MARQISKKKRNDFRRKQKPLILIIAEGKNVTESQYFQSFQERYAEYNIKILIPGHITDPTNMQTAIENYWKQYDLDEGKGDIAFIVLDLDCDENKARLIEELSRKSHVAQFVVSNPCFEVWFLLHFKYTTHHYSSCSEVIQDLRVFIDDYEKSLDVSPIMKDRLAFAMKNAEKLQSYYDELGYDWPSDSCNPRTDVPIIIKEIQRKQR